MNTVKKYIDKLKKNYVTNKVKNTKKPDFESESIIRKEIIFSGKVQGVGFRFEVYEMANSLELTGWVKNTEDGKVHLVIQGPDNKIQFLIDNMKKLKRANVTDVDFTEIPIVDNETSFNIEVEGGK